MKWLWLVACCLFFIPLSIPLLCVAFDVSTVDLKIPPTIVIFHDSYHFIYSLSKVNPRLDQAFFSICPISNHDGYEK